MSEHVWKIGDWCEWGIERHYLWKLCDFPGGIRIHLVNVAGSTAYTTIEDPRLKHLPDCTGWTWQPTPKLQLREGAWYERADGKVVGPCLRRDDSSAPWKVDKNWYRDDGVALGMYPSIAIIREAPAPAPKYRPFANAAEFAPHRDRWLVNKGGKLVGRVCGYDETDCYFIGPVGNGYSGTWEKCFGHVVFDDTKLPFGVEVTE